MIDSSADNYQQLVDDLLNRNEHDRSFDVVLLDGELDGLEQVTEALAGYDNLDAVHLVSHGTAGQIRLGNTWLSDGTLDAYASDIARWNDALRDGADLLIYGCDLASNEEGRALTIGAQTFPHCTWRSV